MTDTTPTDLSARVEEALRHLPQHWALAAESYPALAADWQRLRSLSDVTRLDVMWQELVKERDAAVFESQRLRERERVLTEALTPSGATKAAYIGEHKCDHVRDGDEPHLISWSVVKDIMAMIRARAALSPEPKT